MAFPTFVGAGTLVEATTAAVTPAPNASHATGDYEIAVFETQDQAVGLATANGFTAHPGSPVSAASGTATVATRLTVFERIWDGSAGSPTTDATSRNHTLGVIFSFRKSSGTWASLADARSAVQATGWQTSAETVEDGTGVWPDLASAESQDYLLVGITAHAKPDIAGGTAELSAITNANLGSITERFDDAAASGNGGWIGAFTGQKTGGGAPGTTTYTKATASYKAHMVIALRDAAPSSGISYTQASEIDSALGLAKAIGIAQASETDAAQGIAKRLGFLHAAETDAAQGLAKRIEITAAVETDLAGTISLAGGGPISFTAALETDLALGLSQRIAFGPAIETDLAFGLSKRIGFGIASETDLAAGLAKRLVLTGALEADVALGIAQRLVLGVATELDEALALTVVGPVVLSYFMAVEVDEAGTITVVQEPPPVAYQLSEPAVISRGDLFPGMGRNRRRPYKHRRHG